MNVGKDISGGFHFGIDPEKVKKLLMHLHDGILPGDYIIPQSVVQATIATQDDYEFKEVVIKFAEKRT